MGNTIAQRVRNHIDFATLVAVLALMLLSLGVVYSASSSISMRKFEDSEWMLVRHSVKVGLAIVLRDTTLIKLLDRKFDLLVQLAPAFMIGIHWSGLRARPVLAGMVAGVSTALGLYAAAQQGVFGAPSSLVAGVHPGLYGLVLNAAIAVGGSLLPGSGVAGRGDAAGARVG